MAQILILLENQLQYGKSSFDTFRGNESDTESESFFPITNNEINIFSCLYIKFQFFELHTLLGSLSIILQSQKCVKKVFHHNKINLPLCNKSLFEIIFIRISEFVDGVESSLVP